MTGSPLIQRLSPHGVWILGTAMQCRINPSSHLMLTLEVHWWGGPEQVAQIDLRPPVDVAGTDWRMCGSCGGAAHRTRNGHELPHVLERAVVRATGPMLEAPGVWLSSLDAARLSVRWRWQAIRGSTV